MKLIFDEEDILMGEFELTADFFISQKQPVQHNHWLQAYTGTDSVYYIVVRDKEKDEVIKTILATPDPLLSSSLFYQIVHAIGYTDQQQGQEAMERYTRLYNERGWEDLG